MNPRTSVTHPLRVDFIDQRKLRLPGRLGLTLAPGKKQPYGATGAWNRDLETDLTALRDEFKTDLLVSLIEEHEFIRLQIPTLRERAPLFDIDVLWFPIRDASVPTSIEKFDKMVEKIASALLNGNTVVIHCMGGLGRTGLVAAAVLAKTTSLSPEEAISTVRRAREGAIETTEQADYLVTFHRYLEDRRSSGNKKVAQKSSFEHIDELLRFLSLFDEPNRAFSKWNSSESTDDEAIQIAFPDYDDDVKDFLQLASGPFWDDSAYVPEWAQEMVNDQEIVNKANLDEIKTMLTWCVRGERFSPGHLGTLLEQGKIVALLKRLKEIRSEID